MSRSPRVLRLFGLLLALLTLAACHATAVAANNAGDSDAAAAVADAALTAAKDAATADLPADVSAADAVDPCLTATPVTCFVGAPPSATECVAALAEPADNCPELATPAWFDGQPVPKPTLPVQIGRYDAAGAWQAVQDGDWMPLQTANQGAFHFGLWPRVLLAGPPLDKIKLQVEAFAAYQCNAVADKTTAQKFFYPQGTGLYGAPANAALLTVFGVTYAKKKEYCGLWYRLVFRARVPGTSQWGEAAIYVRSYDGTSKPVELPP